ncbi:MAG: Ig-like domain lipoprotein [Idiomarinaceae bacterium HL-53]|nr:MAG: Ig-like domain lipoprotein [Idiomarinaceae bacterium HL-53]CUS49184.1 Ig-like domain (group 2) [Idiomarinaceae bacterium HL-53]
MRYLISFLLVIALIGCGGSDKKIESIEINAVQQTLALGDSTTLSVVANFNNDTSRTLTIEEVELALSGDDAISLNGLTASSVAEGVANISAEFKGFSDTVEIEVTAAELRELVVSDLSISLALGQNYQFEIDGIYSNGERRDVSATYSGFDTQVIDVTADGLVSTVSQGGSEVLIAFGDLTETASVTVTEAKPAAIALGLSPNQVAAGESSSARVTVTYTDGTVLERAEDALISSDSDLVTLSGPEITTLAPGTATILADLGGLTDTAELTITDAIPTELTLSASQSNVPVGTTLQMTAEAYYSDGNVRNVVNEAQWSVGDPNIATISESGVVTGLEEGNVEIFASFSGYEDTIQLNITEAILTSVQVTPTDSFNTYEGGRFNANAQGEYSDGSNRDITAEVTWSSSDEGVATVSNHSETAGRVSAVTPGEAEINASLGDFDDAFTLVVEELVVTSIEVTSTPLVGNNGVPLVPARLLNSSRSPDATFSDDGGLPEGRTRQLYALGTFQNGDVSDITENVTWSISDTSVAQFEAPQESPGLLTARTAGGAQVTAVMGNIEGSYDLTVVDAVLESLDFSHEFTRVFVGESETAQVVGTFSNGETRSLNEDASWQTSDASIFQVSNQSGTKGRITGVSAGDATVTAAIDGITTSQIMTVAENEIESVVVSADQSDVYRGRALQLSATAEMTSGDSRDVTSEGSWTVNNTNIGTVTDAGELSAVAAGNVDVTFTAQNGVSDSFVVRVKPISEMADEFSKGLSASVVIINGIVQQGSQFGYSITNNTGVNLDLVEFRANDATRQLISTTDPSNLNGGVIGAGTSHGLTITIGLGGATTPITFTFVVRDPVTGESFNVSRVYN